MAAQIQQLSRLSLHTPAAPAQPADKLAKSAKEFESILLQNWLEKMNESFVGSEGSQDPAHATVSSMGTQAIAQALADRGGIGIAKMILKQLRLAEERSEPPSSARPAD